MRHVLYKALNMTIVLEFFGFFKCSIKAYFRKSLGVELRALLHDATIRP